MKKFLVFLFAIVIGTAFAHTIDWYADGQIISTTTCDSGDNITPPTAPSKRGYHLKEWATGYIQLEYIESTGTQWIDTGVHNTGGLIIETKAQPTNPSSTGEQAYVGNVQQNADVSRNVILWKEGQWHVQKLNKFKVDGASVADAGLSPAVIKFNSVGNNYRWWYNGTQIADSTTSGTLGSNTGNVLISKVNYNNLIGKGRYYYVKIWNSNDTLIRDLIPAKRVADNAIGMYDTVTQTFFTNAGTGDFVAGPVVGGL